MIRRFIPLLMALTWAAGNLSPIFIIWLLWPREGLVHPPGEPGLQPLVIDFVLALVFPLQHSLWTQTPIKAGLRNALTEYFERPMYVLTSALALAVMCLAWRSSSMILWEAPAAWVWSARVLFILSLATQSWCSMLVGPRFLTGLTQLKAFRNGVPVRSPEFQERGLYRVIRHPIAASQIVMVWCFGTLGADRLLLSGVWTVWIITATALEDRRLAREFGSTYAEYRQRAGFLLPRIG